MTNRNKWALLADPPMLVEDPSTFDTSAADPELTLGGVYWYGGDAYRYVQFLDAVAYTANHLCTWANATGTAVTNDRAGGSDVGELKPAGIATRVHTQNYYGFIQITGVADVLCDGSVAAGESVIPHATTDGMADTMAGTDEDHVFGVALEADSGSPVTAAIALRGLI